MGQSSFSQGYTPAPVAPVINMSEDRYGGSSASTPANKPFKTKGMQLGAKGAKKQADLLESLGGGVPLDEDVRAPLIVSRRLSR